jgi:hypothetical protein
MLEGLERILLDVQRIRRGVGRGLEEHQQVEGNSFHVDSSGHEVESTKDGGSTSNVKREDAQVNTHTRVRRGQRRIDCSSSTSSTIYYHSEEKEH